MHRDPHFGPLMMFGMGGMMVEVMKDVSFYLAPLTAEEAKQMLVNTRTYKMLNGVRGQEGVDIDAIAEGLQRLSQLVTEFPEIQEMDINPYMVGAAGHDSHRRGRPNKSRKSLIQENISMPEFDWKEKYKTKITTAADAMKLIKSGNNIFIGTGCASPSISSQRWSSIPRTSTMPISSTC